MQAVALMRFGSHPKQQSGARAMVKFTNGQQEAAIGEFDALSVGEKRVLQERAVVNNKF